MSDDRLLTIVIVCRSEGSQGYSEPLYAFLTQQEADAAMALLSNSYTSFKAFRVAVWPHVEGKS